VAGNRTVADLFEVSIALGKKLRDLYGLLRKKFSHLPEAEYFWLSLQDDEISHFTQLELIRRSLKPDELNQPADEATLKRAESLLEKITAARWDSIRNLEDAYEAASDWENSEANQVFLFLAHRYIPGRERIKLVDEVIGRHLNKLMTLPDIFGDAARRREIRARD